MNFVIIVSQKAISIHFLSPVPCVAFDPVCGDFPKNNKKTNSPFKLTPLHRNISLLSEALTCMIIIPEVVVIGKSWALLIFGGLE